MNPVTPRRLAAALLGLILAGSGLASSNLPSDYPDPLPHMGRIDDIHSGGLVINDRLYKLSDSVQIHRPGQRVVPRSALEKGQQLGFSTSNEARSITEIWILPQNYRPGGHEE